MAVRSSWDCYSPVVSSPLNPKEHVEPALGGSATAAATPTTPPKMANKRHVSYGQLSPTQRLLVQKKELAWSLSRDYADEVEDDMRRTGIDDGRARPRCAPVLKAHWEDGVEAQDFFEDDGADECEGDRLERNTGRWSTSVLDLSPRILYQGSGRSLLWAAGAMCLGGCLPVWAFMATGGPAGIWSLGEASPMQGASILDSHHA